MSIEEFLETCPIPAPVKSGEKKVLSCILTPSEYEMVQYLAHHPNTKLLFDGNLYAVIRHALALYLPEMAEAIEDKQWTPKVLTFKRRNQAYALELTKPAVYERLDLEGHSLNLLLDFGQYDGALKDFKRLLDEIWELPKYWRSIVLHFIREHKGMIEFEDRINKDLVWRGEYQMIWEGMPE